MVRIEATADDSLAAMRERSRLGIAMAAMIRMIATTISSSISEKPLCFLVLRLLDDLCFVMVRFSAKMGWPLGRADHGTRDAKPPLWSLAGVTRSPLHLQSFTHGRARAFRAS